MDALLLVVIAVRHCMALMYKDSVLRVTVSVWNVDP